MKRNVGQARMVAARTSSVSNDTYGYVDRQSRNFLSSARRSILDKDPADEPWLDRVETTLNGIVGGIRQISNRHARRLSGIAVGKLSGVVTVGGITGLVSAFGTAGTGTAIGTLSGAAATSATLGWIGSLVGLGAVAGGTILAATGVGAGILAAFMGKRWLLGSKRGEKDLENHEKAILASCLALITAINEQRHSGEEVTSEDKKLFAELALLPMVSEINTYWDRSSMAKAGVEDGVPFDVTLKVVHRSALQHHTQQLKRLAEEVME